jgi:predicted  nucleic acid-binding Zn-ribbon protein
MSGPLDYKAEINKRMEDWDAKLEDLRSQARNASSDEEKARLLREAEEITVKIQALEKKLEEAESVQTNEWDNFKDAVQKSVNDIESSISGS